MGPGARNCIEARLCAGMAVDVDVGRGVGVSDGVGESVGASVSVGATVGMEASTVSVAARFAPSAVMAMIVGRYSGGYGVGMEAEAGAAQPANNPRREAMKRKYRFIYGTIRQQVQWRSHAPLDL